jgi:hypothetical protein
VKSRLACTRMGAARIQNGTFFVLPGTATREPPTRFP